MIFKRLLLFFVILTNTILSRGQTDSISSKKSDEKRKAGWSFGAIPAVAFDTDIGFKYGAVVNLYNYGNGDLYPNYLYSIYAEWSRTTKGSGINQIFFDSKYLLPKGIRITADINLFTEKALDFYGFNGYNAYYNHAWEDDHSNAYISRMFYKQDRKLSRILFDFQGNISESKLKWIAGFGYFNNKIGPVNIAELNKGLSDSKKLADTPCLYQKYIDWGVIPSKQKNGGTTNYIRGGIIYDTRDNEANPMKGLWTEAILIAAPSFLGNGNLSYSQISFIHRQYFTLIEKKLSFAGRLGYQTKLSGEIPFYMLPFLFNSYQTRDGFGGAKSMRGILRNRVVGEGVAYGNLEFRWKFIRTTIFNQNFYVALSSFTDMGMVTKKFKIDDSKVPEQDKYLVNAGNESLHASYGAGLHFALNQNFIVAVDYGIAADKRDGRDGLYINLNFLY
jgi:outer membrane protein assembly factor BamA